MHLSCSTLHWSTVAAFLSIPDHGNPVIFFGRIKSGFIDLLRPSGVHSDIGTRRRPRGSTATDGSRADWIWPIDVRERQIYGRVGLEGGPNRTKAALSWRNETPFWFVLQSRNRQNPPQAGTRERWCVDVERNEGVQRKRGRRVIENSRKASMGIAKILL